ncbi:MAG TPA: hypothetical protein VGO93_06795 [Candidatus Xenobia bacterium]|jgi:hypothetical protein
MIPWNDTVEGPDLASLLRRLTECPAEFLAEPGGVDVAAVVSDLLCDLGHPPLPSDTLSAPRPGEDPAATRNRLSVTLVSAWLLHDDWFIAHRSGAAQLFTDGLDDLAKVVRADQFVSDAERREELARWCLLAFGLRPSGESVAAAQDRLTTLSSAERARVVQATRKAEERARQVREEMIRKAAQEAAPEYGQE